MEPLLTIYRLLIRSKIDYRCTIYNTAKPIMIKHINNIQNTAMRLVKGTLRTSLITSQQNITGELQHYNTDVHSLVLNTD